MPRPRRSPILAHPFRPHDQALIETLRRVLTPIGYRITSVTRAPRGRLRSIIGSGRSRVRQLAAEGQHGITNLEIRPAAPTVLWLAAGAAALLAGMLLGRKSGGRVKNVMSTDVETIEPSASLKEAAQRMRNGNIGVLPVVEDQRLTGILTDRDIVTRGVARGLDPASVRVSDCATSGPVFARPEWRLDRAMSLMAEHQIGRLPVLDDADRLVGIVTLSSLALRGKREKETLKTARDVADRSARAS